MPRFEEEILISPLEHRLVSKGSQIAMSNLYPRHRQPMTFTSTNCTARMVDITGFSPGVGGGSTAVSATSNTFMAEASASEDVEIRKLSGAETDSTGERRRKGSWSRLMSRANGEI